jgi:DnaD/phage-associated family protein
MPDDILKGFPGFAAGPTQLTPLPSEFFGEILPIVDDLAELKVILYVFWKLAQGSGDVRYVRLDDALADLVFLAGMGETPEEQEAATRNAFARAAQRGVLIEIEVKRSGRSEKWYFLNSPKGRRAVERLRKGDFRGLIHDIDDVIVGLEKERPNIFLLYEQNIGLVTPMAAERLRQLERDYPEEWIYDAFSLAVERNARNLAYIHRILKNWAQNGKDTPAQPGRALKSGHIADTEEPDEPGLFIHE